MSAVFDVEEERKQQVAEMDLCVSILDDSPDMNLVGYSHVLGDNKINRIHSLKARVH